MTLALLFALEAECAAWRARRGFRRVSDARRGVYTAQIGPSCVRIAIVGIRAPHVRALAPEAFAGQTDAVVAVGLAGALRPQYPGGVVIVARSTRSGTSGPAIRSDDRLVALAERTGATVVESLLTVDHVVSRSAEKRRLAEHGDAVDMESFAGLSEAVRRGIPAVAIRVIGDSAGEDLPLDFTNAIRPDGTLGVGRLVLEAVRCPDRWPSLVSFGLRQQRALRTLAAFLDRFLEIF